MSSTSSSIVDIRLQDRAGGQVAYVTVNNAQHRNRLGKTGKQDLIDAFTSLASNEQLRVAVLRGAGDKSFIAGSDLAEMKDVDIPGQLAISTKTHQACDAIRRLPVPVIAAINGYCFGSGFELAASCDLRAASRNAKFGLPEVKFGLPSGMEACLLPGLVGWGKARELALTGEWMDAEEAYRCGFLERLVEVAELDASVENWVASICAAGPRAVRIQKALISDWERLAIKDAVQKGIAAMGVSRETDEPARMIQAFIDRKKT